MESNQANFAFFNEIGLQTTNEAQVATKVVFRILHDLMLTEEIDKA